MKYTLKDSLDSIRMSFAFFGPELTLFCGIVLLITAGIIWKKRTTLFNIIALLIFSITLITSLLLWHFENSSDLLFTGYLRSNPYSNYFKILFALSGLLTVVMTWWNQFEQQRLSEYYTMIVATVLGANLLVMSESLLMIFISMEVISISSYILTGFAFDKKGTEGSLKYFVFGSVASAIMLYGFSLLYGIAGTLNFTSIEFVQAINGANSAAFFIGGVFSLAGLMYKMAAAPMHPWAPDVYEAAPMPVVAFFSVVPKFAGVAILAKFILSLNQYGQSVIDWQLILSGVAILTLTVGNFSALKQRNVKRLMAYSGIAQSGFLMIGVIAFSNQGLQFLVFYSTVYLLLNFLVFIYLQYFENRGFTTIASYEGSGKNIFWPSVFLLIGFIGLTGLPPTAGFTGKLFIFTALWDSYSMTSKPLLLWLLIFGLLNTVVSLFYYLRIPYYAFIRQSENAIQGNNLTSLNLLGGVLVLLILILFFSPGLLMGWINKINFVF